MKTRLTLVSFLCTFFQLNMISFGQVMEDSANVIFHKGSWELNFSASIGNLTTSTSSSSSGAYIPYSNEKSSSMFYVQLGVIPAYFVSDGLSIEPEVNVLFQSQEGVKNKPSLSFLANLAYNFNLPQKNFSSFIRIGYGISNSLQIPVVVGGLARVSDDLDVSVLNAGVGFKFLIAQNLLIRTELNYRRFSYGNDMSSSYYSSSYDYTLSSISGIFGFSILL